MYRCSNRNIEIFIVKLLFKKNNVHAESKIAHGRQVTKLSQVTPLGSVDEFR